jgi:hypothetical protein
MKNKKDEVKETSLEEVLYCKGCGNPLEKDDTGKYCKYCKEIRMNKGKNAAIATGAIVGIGTAIGLGVYNIVKFIRRK